MGFTIWQTDQEDEVHRKQKVCLGCQRKSWDSGRDLVVTRAAKALMNRSDENSGSLWAPEGASACLWVLMNGSFRTEMRKEGPDMPRDCGWIPAG